MAETGDQGARNPGAASPPGANPEGAQQPQMPQVRILAHFVRDLSFENVGVIQGTPAQGQPDISVAVHLDGSHIGEGNYQLNMKITAKATQGENTRFLVELDYGGVFAIQNAPESHIHPILFIECPRLLWPFARRVVADVTRDGGYPSLLLDNIDFVQLYRQKVEQMRQQQAEGAAAGGNGESAGPAAGAGEAEGAGEAAAEPGQKPN